MNNLCKECKQILVMNETECACGWKNIETSPNKDYQCRYFLANQQCNKAGTVALQLRGNQWYCSQHVHQVMRDREDRTNNSMNQEN